jgi:hypothetical protein
MTTEQEPASNAPLIYSRIAQCLAEVGAVGKDHRNQQQGYNFRGIDDFYDAFQPVLARHKVFIAPTILEHTREERTTKSGGVMMTTITKVRFRIYTEDGSFIEADALGEGADSGDKSANKAAAQAMKYLFMQVFSVRVNGESFDSEKDSPEYTRQAPQNAPRQQQAPAPRQYQKPAPQANQERKPATPADVLPQAATPKRRDDVVAYLAKTFGAEEMRTFYASRQWDTNWPLGQVPANNTDLAKLVEEIKLFNAAPPEPEQMSTVDTATDNILPESIAESIITVPRRGMKRDEYLQNPDTIGGLYRAMKDGDADAGKRLWGLARGWSPEPYVSPKDGKKYPVSKEDAQCRIDLDTFCDWYDNNHDKEEGANE